jgi:hypothetical protein
LIDRPYLVQRLNLTVQQSEHLLPTSWVARKSLIVLELTQNVVLNICDIEMVGDVAQKFLS